LRRKLGILREEVVEGVVEEAVYREGCCKCYGSPRGGGTIKNPKNIWKKNTRSCFAPDAHRFLPGQMHKSMSVSAQGFAKDNLHWVNSSDLTIGSITEGKHHELIHA